MGTWKIWFLRHIEMGMELITLIKTWLLLQFILAFNIWYLPPNSWPEYRCYQVLGRPWKESVPDQKTCNVHDMILNFLYLQGAKQKYFPVDNFFVVVTSAPFSLETLRRITSKWIIGCSQINIALFLTVLLRQSPIQDYHWKKILVYTWKRILVDSGV